MTTQDVAETCHQALLAADIAVSGWQYKVVDAKTLNHSAHQQPTKHEDDHTDGHPGGISVLVSCGVGNGARGVSAACIACCGLEGVTDSQQHRTDDDADQGHIHPHPSDHAHQAHKLQGGQDII
mgnify:CR=1 FL=1